MKVIKLKEISKIIKCPNGDFISNRFLLEQDGMGYTITKTIVPKNITTQKWHYKKHLESCYCISGKATLINLKTNEEFDIEKDTLYVLDKHDPHKLITQEETELICVFNPPLIGNEIHNQEGVYESEENNFTSPVYNVKRVHMSKVISNEYNPNKVAPPEMALLETSIWEDGYTQPIVTFYNKEENNYIVVDGFHRYLTMKNSKRIREREREMLPIVVIDKLIGERMASTIRHNRARGSHNLELMSVIVAELVEMGKGDRWICNHIGMSPDELLRLKQITGLAGLFKDKEFSSSWEADSDDDWENVEFEGK